MSNTPDIGGICEIVVSLMQIPEELKSELLRYRMADQYEWPDALLKYEGRWYIDTKFANSYTGISLVLKDRKE